MGRATVANLSNGRKDVKTRAILISGDDRLVDWLRSVLGALVEIDTIPNDDLTSVASQFYGTSGPRLVFVEFSAGAGPQRTALVERLVERFPQVPVAGIAAPESADLVLPAIRAGARDFFVMGRDDQAISNQVSRILQRADSTPTTSESQARKGRLISVMGAGAGPEIPFLGIHLALALNETKRTRERILLLDITTPGGAAAVFLNLGQTYTVIDVMRDAHRCDETLIDTAFSKHPSGIYVLSLPEETIGSVRLDTAEMSQIVAVLQTLFSFVVVTVDGGYSLEGIAALLDQSDRSVVLCDQSILKSRHTKHLIRALRVEGCAFDQAGLVVDDYRRRLSLEPDSLAELLDLPLLAALQTDSMDRIVAMNSGESMFASAKRDPYCSGVRKLAAVLSSEAAAAPAEPLRAALRSWLT